MARSQRPDLILMDIQLPVVDGYEATRSIKRDPELKHIPVIAVTSYALSGDEERAREAGCDAYVAKPSAPAICWRRSASFSNSLCEPAACTILPAS